MRLWVVIFASLFSLLCPAKKGPGSSNPDGGSGPGGNGNVGVHGGNPNAVSLQGDAIHSGSLTGSLTPPLARLWSFSLRTPGRFWAPMVANGNVYAVGVDSTNKEVIVSIDGRTGSQLWSQAVPAGTAGLAYNDGILAVTTASSGTVAAFDAATGNQLWSQVVSYHLPILAPPVMANGLVYVSDLDAPQGHLTVFNETSGTGLTNYAYGMPAVTDKVVIIQGDRTITGYDQATGAITPIGSGPALQTQYAESSVSLYDNFLFVQSTPTTLTSQDLSTGLPTQNNYATDMMPAADGSNLYLGGLVSGSLTSVDIASGKQNWMVSTPGLAENPLVVNGVVYIYLNPSRGFGGQIEGHSETDGSVVWSDMQSESAALALTNLDTQGGIVAQQYTYAGLGSDGNILVVNNASTLVAYGSMSGTDGGP
jgi:outer membrane protein assembly factor BamB